MILPFPANVPCNKWIYERISDRSLALSTTPYKLSLQVGNTESILFATKPTLCTATDFYVTYDGHVIKPQKNINLGVALDNTLSGECMVNSVTNSLGPP